MPVDGVAFDPRGAAIGRDLRVVATGGPALLLSYSLCITSMRFAVPAERRPGPQALGSTGKEATWRPRSRRATSRTSSPSCPAPRPGRTSSSTMRGRAQPAARVPDRPRPRPRLRRRGHRRQRVPRLRRRHRRQLDRPQPPRRRGRDPAPGRRAPALQRQRLLPADLRPGRRRAGADRADVGPARVFIGNSGAEAVEAGLKLARYATKRSNVIAFLGAFHGRTMGAVSLTASKAKYHAHFGPLLPGVYHVPFGERGARRDRAARLQAPDAGRRVRGRHRRADPGRGRLRRPRGRLPAAAARAVRPARDPAHRRRGPVGRRSHREDVGASSTGTSSPTSCSPRRASRRACRSAR